MTAEFLDWPVPSSPLAEVEYSQQATRFSVWSPKAEQVKVNLYRRGEGGVPFESYPMHLQVDGTWTVAVSGNLNGVFYTFQVQTAGKWKSETPGIFAKAVGVNGKRAQVLDLKETNPEGWERDARPVLRSFSDVVLYEMHYRDFSMDKESGISHKGKFLALAEQGTKNAEGLATGLEHLKELGVNHVCLLPSYDYGSVDEARLQMPQYNWGYDPVNYNVPEGSYSTNPEEPAVRIKEFKQMVMALHQAGIRVVMDVVYNHVLDAGTSAFELTAPGYFFRKHADGTYANGSGCGNETASERPMMRKFILESVLYWIKEYHVDGFRFDLMGIHDVETMNAIRKAVDQLDPSIFLYGEGWAANKPAFPLELLAMKGRMVQMPGIAAFGDEMRDALRGAWNNNKKGAFLTGVSGHEKNVKFGLMGAIQDWAAAPTQMISYVSCHDDMCIADRIKATTQRASKEERIRLQKLALTAVLVSQGVPLIWCGDELLRDKKGVHNSYNSPDSVNAIAWKLKTEHIDLFHYIRELISLRKHHVAFHMGKAELVKKHMEFLPVKTKNVVAFLLHGQAVGDTWNEIIVVLNSCKQTVKVRVSQGTYTIAIKGGELKESGLGVFKGHLLAIPPQSAMMIYR